MSFADRDVRCVECGVVFIFSAGEQQFFQERGFAHEPKHCKLCKAKKMSGTVRRRIETPVNCSECGTSTTVPFKPTQNRPVLCASCFSHRPKPPHSDTRQNRDVAAAR
ncbi:MAG: CxxC-x17-CxxC domain-containing protein [Terracidiphilus sp.]